MGEVLVGKGLDKVSVVEGSVEGDPVDLRVQNQAGACEVVSEVQRLDSEVGHVVEVDAGLLQELDRFLGELVDAKN